MRREVCRRSSAPARPLVADDLEPLIAAEARDERQAGSLRDLEVGSVMILPLIAGSQVIGTLNFANQADRRSFDDLDREIAERIAERIALALENARIASERSEIAETLQRGLRPPPIPHIPGWSVAALYRPAGMENMVGGDFYDLFRIEDGWMLVIGDVTGHGARAASLDRGGPQHAAHRGIDDRQPPGCALPAQPGSAGPARRGALQRRRPDPQLAAGAPRWASPSRATLRPC